MDIERIERYLRDYKFCLGRCNHLKIELSVLSRQIDAVRRDTAETLAAPKPKPLSDMPRGTQISNPTEKYGGMLADGFKTDEQILLESKLAECESEYSEKIVVVEYVNSWMSGLTDRERTVIKAHMIDDLGWKDAVTTYNQKFGDAVSKDTLKRIKSVAMDKIAEMAK